MKKRSNTRTDHKDSKEEEARKRVREVIQNEPVHMLLLDHNEYEPLDTKDRAREEMIGEEEETIREKEEQLTLWRAAVDKAAKDITAWKNLAREIRNITQRDEPLPWPVADLIVCHMLGIQKAPKQVRGAPRSAIKPFIDKLIYDAVEAARGAGLSVTRNEASMAASACSIANDELEKVRIIRDERQIYEIWKTQQSQHVADK